MDGEIGTKDLGGDAIWAGVVQFSDSYTRGTYPGLDVCDGSCQNEHSGDFVQVLPGRVDGAGNNTLTFRWYEKHRSLSPWLGDESIKPGCSRSGCRREDQSGHWVEPIGFVHWPIQDGYWYRDIRYYNLSKGEVRFASRVFPWTLYPPAVMKSHMFTPLYSSSNELIGGWTVGFKLHWITAYLQDLKKPAGTFIFVVERKTGVLISTSIPEIRILKNYQTNASYQDVIIATECPDHRVSERAKELVRMAGASSRDWSKVRNLFGRPEIKTTGMEPVEEFLLSRDFKFLGLDWVIVISIPGETVLEDINANYFTSLFLILGATGGMKISSSLLLAAILALGGNFCGRSASVADYNGEFSNVAQPPDTEPPILVHCRPNVVPTVVPNDSHIGKADVFP